MAPALWLTSQDPREGPEGTAEHPEAAAAWGWGKQPSHRTGTILRLTLI